MWAADRRSVDGVQLLLNAGGRVDAQDSQGMAAIHIAACEECRRRAVPGLRGIRPKPTRCARHNPDRLRNILAKLAQSAELHERAKSAYWAALGDRRFRRC
jgi:hypothetical protein